MKRNILILDNEFGMGGVEKKLHDFIARVDTERFAIKACALKDGGYFKDKLVAMGVPFYEGILRHKYDAMAYNGLAKILRDEKIDLIYTFAHPNTVMFSYFAKARGHVPKFLVSFHAMGSSEGGKLVPAYVKPFLSHAAVILAVAETHKRYLVEVEGLRRTQIEVIENGVDQEKYRPGTKSDEAALCAELGIAPDDVVMTTIASLKPLKCIDVLLEAAAATIRGNARVKVVLAGDGPSRGDLEAQAERLGIADNVVFAGIRDDVDALLRASDALVLPSRTEVFPNVVLEAMASGVAVLATDVGAVREIVEAAEGGEGGESAVVVPPEDKAALAEAFAALVADDARRERMGRRGREIVEEKFRIEQMCEKREALFERLIEGPEAR